MNHDDTLNKEMYMWKWHGIFYNVQKFLFVACVNITKCKRGLNKWKIVKDCLRKSLFKTVAGI